jgi:hypothetical protein
MDRSTQCVTQTTTLAQIKDRRNQGAVAGTNRFRAGPFEVLQMSCQECGDPDSEKREEREGQGR